MASLGLDPAPGIRRVRDFLLRPLRREVAASNDLQSTRNFEFVALIEQLREENASLRALNVSLAAEQVGEHNLLQAMASSRDGSEAWRNGMEAWRNEIESWRDGLGSWRDAIEPWRERMDSWCENTNSWRGRMDSFRDDARDQSVELFRLIDAERRDRRARITLLEQLVTQGPALSRAEDAVRSEAGLAPIVSIVLPTYNRAAVIGDAIESVLAQSFTRWELLIVDDGSSDDTKSVVARYAGDERIRYSSQEHLGCSAARNHGLRLARGELIAHLDSDNLWYPDFLLAAASALQTLAGVDLVYGVLVTDAHALEDSSLLHVPFNRERLLASNYIDLNTTVHRRSLYELHGGFDEKLHRLVDWDLVLRYTRERAALAIPVLGARYRVCDGHRISDIVPAAPHWIAVKKKWPPGADAPRKPRVLYVVWHYPQLSESYLEGDVRKMRAWGAHVEVWRAVKPASPYPVDIPIHDGSLEEAVRAARPDVIHIHWLSFALSQDALLGRLDVPVTIRMHGFDVTQENFREVLGKPWLHAVYAFPAQLALLGSSEPKVKPVPVAFESELFRPHPTKNHRLVVRTGACLPSKDIALFFELAKRLPRHRFVFAGVTCNEFEPYVDELRRLRDEMGSPVELHFDMPRAEVAELMGEAGLYLHTIHPPGAKLGAPTGMPISIAEAMATGAHVLVRDIPALVDYVGDAGSVYRDLDHAAELIKATEHWTEAQWQTAWRCSVERGFGRHADDLVLRPIFEDWCALLRSQSSIASEPELA